MKEAKLKYNVRYVPKPVVQKNIQCQTFTYYDKDGNKVMKPKKAYDTDKEAIKQAWVMNAHSDTIHKLVAYKCKKCGKWHIGRTDKILTDKEREHAKEMLEFEKINLK